MLKRTLTGLVILIVLAGFIALRLVSPLFFDAFVLLLCYGALLEMFMAYKASNKRFYKWLVALMPIALWAVIKFTNNELLWIALIFVIEFVLSMLCELFILKNTSENGVNVESDTPELLVVTKNTLIVSVYPALLISAFFALNNLGLGLGFVTLILAFGTGIFTDVFAYVFGMLFGQKGSKKLAPEISPKKSVIGSIFGLVGSIIFSGLGWLFFYNYGWFGALDFLTLTQSTWLFSIIGVGTGLLTQMGDLVASAIKRTVGIKDYGHILPGHGGFMDRIDGQIFCATFIYIIFSLFI